MNANSEYCSCVVSRFKTTVVCIHSSVFSMRAKQEIQSSSHIHVRASCKLRQLLAPIIIQSCFLHSSPCSLALPVLPPCLSPHQSAQKEPEFCRVSTHRPAKKDNNGGVAKHCKVSVGAVGVDKHNSALYFTYAISLVQQTCSPTMYYSHAVTMQSRNVLFE